MHTKHPKEDPLVELGYEPRDVNLKLIYRAVTIFFGFTAFSFGVGMLVFNQMHPASNRQTMSSEMGAKRMSPAPGTPLLQNNVTAKTDLMEMRQREIAQLNGTGYANDSKSVVHIPVERAIDLLVERGMPATSEEVPAVSKLNTPTAAPTTPEVEGSPSSPTTTAPGQEVPTSAAPAPKAAGTAITKPAPTTAPKPLVKATPIPSEVTATPEPKKPGEH